MTTSSPYNRSFGVLLALILAFSHASGGKYYIQSDTATGNYVALGVDEDGNTVRYPCESVVSPVPVLVCRKFDGTIIDHDEIYYASSSYGDHSSPAEGNAPKKASDEVGTVPCRSTPGDFDGPGGILCTTTNGEEKIEDGSSHDEPTQTDSKDDKKLSFTKVVLIILLVSFAGLGAGSLYLCFGRNKLRVDDGKSIQEETVCEEAEAPSDHLDGHFVDVQV